VPSACCVACVRCPTVSPSDDASSDFQCLTVEWGGGERRMCVQGSAASSCCAALRAAAQQQQSVGAHASMPCIDCGAAGPLRVSHGHRHGSAAAHRRPHHGAIAGRAPLLRSSCCYVVPSHPSHSLLLAGKYPSSRRTIQRSSLFARSMKVQTVEGQGAAFQRAHDQCCAGGGLDQRS
jgi:hypothetical protein